MFLTEIFFYLKILLHLIILFNKFYFSYILFLSLPLRGREGQKKPKNYIDKYSCTDELAGGQFSSIRGRSLPPVDAHSSDEGFENGGKGLIINPFFIATKDVNN